MDRVAVLMATYNGASFLVEQLESIERQTYQNWVLYIRDDGSTDDTPSIITEFKNRFPNRVTVLPSKKNLGAKGSFENLLAFADEPYYMFCDQDDVWLETKIEETLSEMKSASSMHPDKPILVITDSAVTDENLQIISSSYWQTTRIDPSYLIQQNAFEVFNCAPGCTMMINNALKTKALPFPNNAPMHDWWIAISAQRHGMIYPIRKSLMLYRQHQSNTIGAENIDRWYFVQKAYQLFDTIRVQKTHLKFLAEINGLKPSEFYLIKLKINIRRFINPEKKA